MSAGMLELLYLSPYFFVSNHLLNTMENATRDDKKMFDGAHSRLVTKLELSYTYQTQALNTVYMIIISAFILLQMFYETPSENFFS